MDIQSFIQSGILEAYVAGHCTDAERAEVERLANLHPEVRAELNKIELALEQFAQAQGINPRPGIKDEILDKLEAISGTSQKQAPPPASAGGTTMLRLFQLLSLGAILACGYFLWSGQKNADELDKLRKENQTIAQKLTDCDTRQQNMQQMATLLRDTDTKAVTVTDGKNNHITVFHNPLRKECALDIAGVPARQDGKYLQAWAIVDGNPVDLGMVQMNAPAGWQPLRYFDRATAYAISEEDNPKGNAKPTVVIAMGNI